MLSSLERRGSSKDIHVVWDERAAVSYIRFEFSERAVGGSGEPPRLGGAVHSSRQARQRP